MKRLIAIVLFVVLFPAAAAATDLRYELDVRVDTGHRRIAGRARLTAGKPVDLHLSTVGLGRLQLDGKPLSAENGRLTISLVPGEARVLTFAAVFSASRANYMDSDNVFLTGNWYPRPDGLLATYALTVRLPGGFSAVSEADAVNVDKNETAGIFHFQFAHPVDGISLAASRNYKVAVDRYKDIRLEAYFFAEDAALARVYLSFARKYLAMYENMLTPYPYRRFVVAENLMPTGYSFPTYTLLGKAVVRLPFITRTSLGHEILHQWFGNSVYIDATGGNWSEGITDYLADYHFADMDGRGARFRKQILIDFDAYAHADRAMPVAAFISRHNKMESTIGYGRAAMIFHALERRMGKETFLTALRAFITANRFRRASWDDIRAAFETAGRTDLKAFFDQRLHRADIPSLTVTPASVVVDRGQLMLDFDLIQKDPPVALQVPVTIETPGRKTTRVIDFHQTRKSIRLPLDEPPTRVVLDEGYDLMRRLDPAEIPPTLAKIMGRESLRVITPDGRPGKYRSVIEALGVAKITWQSSEAVTVDNIRGHSLVIAGFQSPPARMLFGRQPVYTDGVRLRMYPNPYDEKEVIALLHVKNSGEAEAIVRTLPHYGRYSRLVFNGGKATEKRQAPAAAGIPVLSRPETTIVRPDPAATLDDILPALISRRVIYVGEQHDRFAHHINQLVLIKRLHDAGRKVAVGMEMFQRPYQPALDAYLAGRIDEHRFLKESAYFEKWRFDYNLYKPIIDYARENRIPVVALNIDGDISRQVARKGIDALSSADRKRLPGEMDFTDRRYRYDLQKIFRMHKKEHRLNQFDFFFQAQVLWDETMAESVHRYLAAHPDTTMVVLAGNGHVQYKYGIPQRGYRRNGFPYAVIVQDEAAMPGIADFVLRTTPIKGKKAPLLGVGIEETEKGVRVVRVTDGSPADKAGIKKDDTIVGLAEKPVKDLVDLKYILFYTPMGATVAIAVDRRGRRLTRQITLSDFEFN